MLNYGGNVLIEASAGTGKTQALAKRLIALVRCGVRPHEIVALTFSRAAAGEIFERFVALLAGSAAGNPRDARLLREVIATQHLSQIGTLDSFLMRMVRSFPLELGLAGELEMMDEYRAGVERTRTSFGILRRTDARTKRQFAEAFALAMNHEDVRSFAASYRQFVSDWHELALGLPDETAWGGRPELPTADAADLAAAADEIVRQLPTKEWLDFAAWVRDFRGQLSAKGVAKKLLECEDLFKGAAIEFTFNRRQYNYGGDEAKAIRAAMAAVYGYVLRLRRETIRGIGRLMSVYEQAYDAKVRRAGKLVFADVPRLILGLGDAERLALEYRMDARIRAWALDEFQDTSREQWRALEGLVGESLQSQGERSVLVVGDCKQAIYGWRNGDVGIFRRQRDSGCYRVRELRKTYRSSPAVVEAVNRVFASGLLASEFPGWESPVHESAHPEQAGFVQKVEISKPEGGRTSAADFVEPVLNALRAVDPVRRGLDAAVLVRSNGFGEQLVRGLRARGLEDIVFEGESVIFDTPALAGFLDLVALADHPGDRHAYLHFCSTPLAAAKYPDGVPEAEALSAEIALSFTTKGLVRTFRELRALLPADPKAAWSEFVECRFTDMLRAAAEFELSAESSTRISDFAGFLSAKQKRSVAAPGKIRVMTIHHAKGLGFDYVVLPLYEHLGIDADPKGPLLGDGWVLPDPGRNVASALPVLSAAWEARLQRRVQEELSIYYVAMTRAKKAMTLVLEPTKESATARRFSDIVRAALPDQIGTPAWYEGEGERVKGERVKGEDEPLITTLGQRTSSSVDYQPPTTNHPRRRIRRRLPSLGFQSGQSAGDLFVSTAARRQAAEHGIAIHGDYEKVDWIAPEAAKDDFDRALVKPADVVALWRERSFEVYVDGEWVSGRFDRVVFTDGRAEVLDFKTNAMRRGESVDDFARRMATTYAGQMRAYRAAVAALTGLPIAKVSSSLLLTATRQVVTVT